MKKLLLTMAFSAAMIAVNAQDMKSKMGTPILPEAGDWSIGIDVVPLISDLGNLFHTTNTGFSLSQQNLTLVGLHVMDATTAYRMRLRIGFGSNTQDNMVINDVTPGTAAAPNYVTDEAKASYMNIAIGVGIQKSMGMGRLHGIYGAQVNIGFGSTDSTYTYGNAFTATNQAPTSTLPSSYSAGIRGADGNLLSTNSPERPTEVKSGTTFSAGLSGFIGVEYFFAPKMSFSTEYGWGLAFSSTGTGTGTFEQANGAVAPFSVTPSVSTGKSGSFRLDVTNAVEVVYHFYFQ